MDPLALPFFSSFHNPQRTSLSIRFSEDILSFGNRFVLLDQGRVRSESRLLSTSQIILRLAIVFFATILIMPLACMVYTKLKNRHIGALEVQRLQFDRDRTLAGQLALEQVEQALKAREDLLGRQRAALEKELKEKIEKAQEAALVRTASAITKQHELPPTSGSWYEDAWKVTSKEREKKETEESWTLERINPELSPKLNLVDRAITIILEDGSSVKVLESLLKGTCLEEELRLQQKGSIVEAAGKEKIEKEEKRKAEAGITIHFRKYPARLAKMYLELRMSSVRIENVCIEDLIQLCSLAHSERDDTLKRIVMELLRSLIAFESNFLLKLMGCYIDGIYEKYSPDLFQYFTLINDHTFLSSDHEVMLKFWEIVSNKRMLLEGRGVVNFSLERIVYLLFRESNSEEDKIYGNILNQAPKLLTDTRLSSWDYFVIADILYFGALKESKKNGKPFIFDDLTLLIQKLLEKAIDIRQAKYDMAIVFLRESSPQQERYLELLNEAFREGDYRAALALGTHYAEGEKGLTKDLEKALSYLRLACLDATDTAFTSLAAVLGQSTVRNDARIAELYEQALLRNPSNITALRKLGKYWCLLAPEKDYAKSFDYLSKAAALAPDRHTNMLLGAHHFRGWGRPANQELARHLFEDQNAVFINSFIVKEALSF